MNQKNDFTRGPILMPLLTFAGPVLLAMLLQSLYGAVDLLIVGRFADSANVSAVSSGAQMMMLVLSIIMGLSMGATILIGKQIGEKKPDDAGRTVGAAIMMFAIFALIMTAILVASSRQLAALVNAPVEAFEQTVSYIRICSLGFLFMTAFNVLGAIFRGIGNSQIPLLTVFIASLSNIFGDLLLVAVFHMGASGAAIATVAAQLLSVILSILIIRRIELPFRFKVSYIRFDKKLVSSILRLGFPLALQDFLVSVSFMVILAVVNKLGVNESAGVGVAERLTGFIMLVPSALSQSVAAFVAQNYGAMRMDRAKKTLFYAVGISLIFGICMSTTTFLFGDRMASIFSNDPAAVAAAFEYLKSYAIDCLLTPFFFCYTGYFNGIQKTTFVMAQGIIGGVFIRVPLCLLFYTIKPVSLFRIGLATPCSSMLQIILCLAYYYWLARKDKRNLQARVSS